MKHLGSVQRTYWHFISSFNIALIVFCTPKRGQKLYACNFGGKSELSSRELHVIQYAVHNVLPSRQLGPQYFPRLQTWTLVSYIILATKFEVTTLHCKFGETHFIMGDLPLLNHSQCQTNLNLISCSVLGYVWKASAPLQVGPYLGNWN